MNWEKKEGNQGAALVTTLILMVLLSILIIAMLAMSRKQLRSSSSQEKIFNLHSLRDTALNLAISQLRNGTTQSDEIWASQPGAIRTYSVDGGTPAKIFKLYSDDQMVELHATGNADLQGDLESNWDEATDIYANLNAPRTNAQGKQSFPIVDPRAFEGGGAGNTPEGFSYSADINGVVLGAKGQRLPMPVKWIYILRDGSLGTLDGSNAFVPFENQSPATKLNPLVGRIAFWTDDESCKLNINTASEAIPWDTPRCSTPEDLAYAKQQPVLNEVQRFAGHPATTCLSSVLFPNAYLDPYADRARLQAIYDIVPRVNDNGGIMAGNHERVVPDPDRLYVSVDELLYGSEFSGGERGIQLQGPLADFPLSQRRFFLTANSNSPEVTPDGKPRVCLWPLHHSEGSDGKGSSEYRTPYDNIIQYVTTLGEFGVHSPFSYQRRVTSTQEGDWEATHGMDSRSAQQNQHLVRYLARSLGFNEAAGRASTAPIPGYTENFFSKYGSRNMAYNTFNFLDYIRTVNLVDDTKIDTNGDGILDRRVTPWTKAFVHHGSYRVGVVTSQYLAINRSDNGVAVSEEVKRLLREFRLHTRDHYGNWSIGRRFALNELALVFCAVVKRDSGGSYTPPDKKELAEQLNLQPGQMVIQVGYIPELACPSPGYPHMTPFNNFNVLRMVNLRIDGAQALEPRDSGVPELWIEPEYRNPRFGVGSTSLIFPRPAGAVPFNGYYRMWKGSGMGGTVDYRAMTGGVSVTHSTIYQSGMIGAYYVIDTADEEMEVSTVGKGIDCGVQHLGRGINRGNHYFWQGNKIPAAQIPIPEIPDTQELKGTWGERMVWLYKEMETNPEANLLDQNDVVRSFVISHGDARLGVVNGHIGWARGDANAVKENPLIQHPEWNSDKRHVHTLYRHGVPLQIGDADRASNLPLVKNVSYHPDIEPDFGVAADDPNFKKVMNEGTRAPYPYSVDPQVTRDWDTGPGYLRDGSYTNFPDYGTHPNPGLTPYFDKPFDQSVYYNGSTTSGPEITKPNHIIPSAGMFGSMPTLSQDFIPWTSYLFRPELNDHHIGNMGRSRDQRGSGSLGNRSNRSFPPDHMLLEYFWMPVVQPYAISEPFSTAGKINMNYRLAPFSYIKRATAMHAVLKSERMLAIPTGAGQTYKSSTLNQNWRNPIDAEQTLLQWEDRFDKGDYFQTASEVCEMFLVPRNKGISGSTGPAIQTAMRSFWKQHQLTGDNVIERPYTNIYPRLTTRSNAYRVHYLVQTIQKSRESDPSAFDAEWDSISGEQQGDALIERYIDPRDPDLTTADYEYHTNASALPLDNLYQYRIRHIRRFSY